MNKNLRQAAYRIVEESMSRKPDPRTLPKHIEGFDLDEQEQVHEWVEHIRSNILDDLKNLWWEA